jgi:AraC family transcriptional regulator
MNVEWIKTLNNAIGYIEEHLEGTVTNADVAENEYISSFHFQRVFSLLTGMTVGEYIRNRRLSLAGRDLAAGREKVIDVSLKYGYETPESFAKAFARFHGVTPSQAKNEGSVLKSFNRLAIKIKLEGGSSMEYKIVKKEALRIAARTRQFDSDKAQAEIPGFWTEYMRDGSHEKVCGMMGICAEAKDGRTLYGIGCPEEYIKELPKGFETIEIPAYTWAVFTCRGAMPKAIQEMWGRIYSEWLPEADYELIPSYDIELYTEGDTSSDEYISEIWIPVKKK